MLRFEEIVNLREEVCRGLQTENWFTLSGDTLLAESICMVGRERDSSFLFRFNTTNASVSTHHQSLRKRTHVGLYNLNEKKVRTLLTIDKEEEIIHCTVNRQQTLLAFCVASDGPIKARTTTTRETRLYVADVQHGVRRDNVQFEIQAGQLESVKSAQFLHQTDRKVKLIVFVHGEYIGVVPLVVDITGKLRDKIAKKCKPDWIIGKHFWYQWDIDKQQLFTVTNDTSPTFVTLDVYQCSERTTLDKLFSIPIEINSASRRPRLSKYILEQRSQDRNIVALTASTGNTNDGVLFLCSQVPYDRREAKTADDPFTLTYQIFSFVHEKSVDVSVPNVPGRLRKLCIYFTLIGNYVVAYLPDVFTHIINVHDISDVGALNIISGGESHSRVAECRSTLSRLQLPQLRARPGLNVYMYDSDSMYIYSIMFNEQSLKDKFAEKWPAEPHLYPVTASYPITNQLAVLQHMLQSTADARKTRQLLEYLKNDVTSQDTLTVLTEYILGSSFAVTSRRAEVVKVLCRLLPSTSTRQQEVHQVSLGADGKDGQKGHHYKVNIEIKRCSCEGIDILNELSIKKDNDFFPFLYLLKTKKSVKRFRVEELSRQVCTDIAIKRKNASIIVAFKNIIRPLNSGGMNAQSTNENDGETLYPSQLPTFPDSLLNDKVDEKFVTNLSSVIYVYMRKVYPVTSSRTSTNKGGKSNPAFLVDIKDQELEAMCWTYAKTLINQVKVLLHHLYKVFGLVYLQHSKQYTTQNPEDLLKAFHVLERYQLAVSQLGLPLPCEFPTLFATLAYQSLSAEEFMQYVDCGIVQLTDGFLDVLAIDNTVSKYSVKCECLSRMPTEEALRWSHKLMDSGGAASTATRLVAENLVAEYCNGRNPSGQGNGRRRGSSSVMGSEEEFYQKDLPESYCHLINKMVESGWKPGAGGGLTVQMLETAVFYYTKAENHVL